MRKQKYSQISIDDLLGVPTAGEIVENHGRRLSFEEAAARIGEIIILNISTENHEWFRGVRVLKVVVTPDGERRLICKQEKGLCYLEERAFLLKNKYRGSGGCLPEFSLEVYSV
mgnify:CR=1 FL=1